MSRPVTLVIGLVLSATGIASAATPMVATLSTPTKKESPVLASIVWHCEGTTCTSASALSNGPKSACHEIAKHLGSVVAFHSEGGDFSEEQLAKCNEGVKAK